MMKLVMNAIAQFLVIRQPQIPLQQVLIPFDFQVDTNRPQQCLGHEFQGKRE
ncbi:hypothetical protein OGM63_14735 [Plectonema radiosum NIES-515]|uniref:Uncharacterized protein n=1 Tax=Plectonema radiosum NIES-515 TaxID=2986073 RepID=A0ABT3B058_9CYAN|nr:hypothetical protein [Plectonema radiosum]MCV3214758.1 hypothetical protein [Plectonema radiosum NIES-515]